jgi:alkylation response protein AidB-like acyl-CoA dehydrogenase
MSLGEDKAMATTFFQMDDRDVRFLLYEHLGVDKLLNYETFQDFSTEDFDMILQEAMKVAREALGPTMQDGDRQGVRFEDGVVRVPDSFHSCWKVLVENGWTALSSPPEFVGQGLPEIIKNAVYEFFLGANLAMMSYPGLAVGNGRLIEAFGTEQDKAMFVEKMYTGMWGGTMCLTEPDAGSDVGWLRTKAIPDPDSQDPRIYRIEGTKRFISCGEHDLTKNIIHLVLARIQGAQPGTKGISLFIVPKIWVNPDGSLGGPNDVICTGIEHKMGVHGSSTCSLSFGETGQCRGILLGEPHSGMAKMFQMMNEARLGVGLMGLALATRSYDAARQYAKERVQGPVFTRLGGDRVPIIQHEDVRRMLMNLKAGTEAMRALVGKVSYLVDVSQNDPEQEVREDAHRQVELFTPLVKAYCSDFGYDLTADAVQILGGVGYCSEFPVEQYARDAKINSIWEGTNYIQALDLIGRKLPMKGGKVFQDWIQGVLAFTGEHKEDPEFSQDFKLLFRAAQAVGDYALRYQQYLQGEKARLIPLTATRFQECFSEVLMGQLLLEQALIARDRLPSVKEDTAEGAFYRGKMETAHYFCRNILVQVFARHAALQSEDTSALDIPESAF